MDEQKLMDALDQIAGTLKNIQAQLDALNSKQQNILTDLGRIHADLARRK